LRIRELFFWSALTIAASVSGAQAADKVRVAVASVATSFAPIFAAQELGYFKENNLDVEATVYGGGGPAQEAMAAGAADIVTLSPMTVALAVAKGIKEKVVAAGGPVTPGGFHIIVRKDSGIRKVADLNGKRIGVTAAASTTDFFALWAAKNANITVRTIPLGGNGLLPAIKNNQVEAVVLFPSVSFRALADNALLGLVDLGKEMEPIVPDSVVASDELIEKRPDVLRRYLKSLLKAVDYMQKNESYSKAFLAKYMGETDQEIVNRSFSDILMQTRTDGLVKQEWVKASLELMKLVGMTSIPPVSDVFTDKFLPVAQ
jgi:NitT/TauT family transport system substrate-binding protein